jgi:hypothetical protein
LSTQLGVQGEVFDLNGDAVVDQRDLGVWVHDLMNTYFGDANFDGEFSSLDLVSVLAAGQYEDGIVSNSGWESGDWDGNGNFHQHRPRPCAV